MKEALIIKSPYEGVVKGVVLMSFSLLEIIPTYSGVEAASFFITTTLSTVRLLFGCCRTFGGYSTWC